MSASYRNRIARLIENIPFDIDADVQVSGRPPTMASSMFLTNKEQGEWAEEIVCNAINECSEEYRAVRYGGRGSLSAGDPGFSDYWRLCLDELNAIGKKPDILVYRRNDVVGNFDLEDDEFVQNAAAAIEVRSSSFLAGKYASFMENRTREAEAAVGKYQKILLEEPYSSLLQEKSPNLHSMMRTATADTFRELSFRSGNWQSTKELRELSGVLRSLKEQIKTLQKRDYLSITPKLEDFALVNRWIQRFGVRYCYLQVFFDKAYVVPFSDILEIIGESKNEGTIFSVERDVKNQGKTTIKVNVQVGREILGKIDMPRHRSELKELERGRLLYYVTFHGGRGYLDPEVFSQEITNECRPR